jgi:hypothetical protein
MYPAAPSGPGFIGTGFSFGCWVLELCAFAIPNNAQMQREAKMSETIRHADFFMKILHPLEGMHFGRDSQEGQKFQNTTWKVTDKKRKTTQRDKGTKGQRGSKVYVFLFFDPLSLCVEKAFFTTTFQLCQKMMRPAS